MKKFNYSTLLNIPLVFLSTSSIALAEENGWFIGGSYQMGSAVMKRYANTNFEWIDTKIQQAQIAQEEAQIASQPPSPPEQVVAAAQAAARAQATKQALLMLKEGLQNQLTILNSSKKARINGIGIKAGFKQFFGQSKVVGLRYYAFFDWGYADFGKGVLPGGKYTANLLNYGVGSDFLWNFVDVEALSIGIFAGFDIGRITWANSGKNYLSQYFPSRNVSYSNFQMAANLGLRTNIAKHHGFEIGIRLPFIRSALLKTTAIRVNNVSEEIPFSYNVSIKRDFSISFSYLYTF